VFSYFLVQHISVSVFPSTLLIAFPAHLLHLHIFLLSLISALQFLYVSNINSHGAEYENICNKHKMSAAIYHRRCKNWEAAVSCLYGLSWPALRLCFKCFLLAPSINFMYVEFFFLRKYRLRILSTVCILYLDNGQF
jgi:hypothetical protein